jgi:Nitrogenase molybdenum-iron protein, alpha and beta chains
MASTNINLNMTSVENREYRLGTIIGWDGKASDLIKESAYDERSAKKHGGCAGKGSGCKLCELASPLNQETMCSNAIIQCQVGNLTDCALIDHSPIGCSGENSKFNLSMHVGLKRRGKPLQNTLNISTNLKEQDMVFGASEKLRQTIRDAKERFNPKAISSAWLALPLLSVKTLIPLPKKWNPKSAYLSFRCIAKVSAPSTGLLALTLPSMAFFARLWNVTRPRSRMT